MQELKDKALSELLVRQEVFRTKMGSMLNGNKRYHYNYEELKKDLKFEDAFFEIVIKAVAERYGLGIKFEKGDIWFIKK